MLRMAVLERICGWFFCCLFIRGQDKRSEGDQSIIRDLQIRSNTLADLPEKALKK